MATRLQTLMNTGDDFHDKSRIGVCSVTLSERCKLSVLFSRVSFAAKRHIRQNVNECENVTEMAQSSPHVLYPENFRRCHRLRQAMLPGFRVVPTNGFLFRLYTFDALSICIQTNGWRNSGI
jgi:hypothetical protein